MTSVREMPVMAVPIPHAGRCSAAQHGALAPFQSACPAFHAAA